MSYATDTYPGNGAQTNFALSFPYLDAADVSVAVNGVPVAFTWLNANTVTVSPAPANGAEVRITRATSRYALLVDFTNGQLLTETELDLAYRHSLYVAQEAFDASEALENYQLLQDWVAAAAASAASAAASLGAVDASASAAATSATGAATSATGAATSASNAAASAAAAAASAATAAGYATSALLKTNNLSDVVNVAAAQANLGLGTAAQQNIAYFVEKAAPVTSAAMQVVGAGSASTSGPAAKLLELKSNTANTDGGRWMFTHYKSGAYDFLTLGASDDAGSLFTPFVAFRRTGYGTPLIDFSSGGADITFDDISLSSLAFNGSTTYDQITRAGNTDSSIDFGIDMASSGLWGWGRVDAGKVNADLYYNAAPVALSAFTGTISNLNLSASNRFTASITGNTTISAITWPFGPAVVRIKLTVGGSGSYTVALPSSVKKAAGTSLTVSTAVGKVDYLVLDWDGTIAIASLMKDIG